MKFNIGDLITLIDKGIHRSEYGKPYVDSYRKGRPSFFRITRIGNKYLYGFFQYYNKETGDWEEHNMFESKIRMTDYVIIKGLDIHPYNVYNNFEHEEKLWEEEKRKVEYNARQKAHELERSITDEWLKNNPRPEIHFDGEIKEGEEIEL